MNFGEIKTKNFQNMLNNLEVSKALVVLEDGNTNAALSARNIANVKTAWTNTINVYDILKYNTVIVTKAVVATIEEVIRIMADIKYYDVILKPVITEKSMELMADKKYTLLSSTHRLQRIRLKKQLKKCSQEQK